MSVGKLMVVGVDVFLNGDSESVIVRSDTLSHLIAAV